ncbi:radical SAM protein [Gammaproteobacteria bacterium ESL0073]|nr:radical SAM protein [Gammaproteobacteria bacterium ESL0073]
MKTLTVLYRGALETCNYACDYCPFAKRKETPEKKQQDIIGLTNFIKWITRHPHINFTVFFTPWGEALVFKRYQQALAKLCQLSNVSKVIIQTNLSAKLNFLTELDNQKLRFWCTYHPSETALVRFIKQLKILNQHQMIYSVGMVGKPELFDEIKQVRHALSPNDYLWINAYVEDNKAYQYNDEQIIFLTTIDPLFPLNKPYKTLNLPCTAGEQAITVDELGDIRRCHFIKNVIGNIQQTGWQRILTSKPCTNHYCDCHIGYVFLESFNAKAIYGNQALERIPLNQNPTT